MTSSNGCSSDTGSGQQIHSHCENDCGSAGLLRHSLQLHQLPYGLPLALSAQGPGTFPNPEMANACFLRNDTNTLSRRSPSRASVTAASNNKNTTKTATKRPTNKQSEANEENETKQKHRQAKNIIRQQHVASFTHPQCPTLIRHGQTQPTRARNCVEEEGRRKKEEGFPEHRRRDERPTTEATDRKLAPAGYNCIPPQFHKLTLHRRTVNQFIVHRKPYMYL